MQVMGIIKRYAALCCGHTSALRANETVCGEREAGQGKGAGARGDSRESLDAGSKRRRREGESVHSEVQSFASLPAKGT